MEITGPSLAHARHAPAGEEDPFMRMPLRIRVGRASAISPGRESPTLSADERLFALGTRTLADLVAPAGAEVRRDHLQLDAHYARVLVVTGYPRTVAAGWLAPL